MHLSSVPLFSIKLHREILYFVQKLACYSICLQVYYSNSFGMIAWIIYLPLYYEVFSVVIILRASLAL